MKTVAIAMQKGGVGKSTLVRSLAVSAANSGLNVLALDMDTQQSTTQWAERRPAETPLVRFVTEIELPKVIAQAKNAGCDLVLIDTPPARSTEAPAAIEFADIVLVPCSPDIEAYEQLPRTERLARTTGIPAFAVLTMVQPNSLIEEAIAREIFTKLNLAMVPVVIRRFKAHRDASREGKSVQELQPDSKAAIEVAELWKWLCAHLQL